MKKDENNYLKDRAVCKNCYYKKRKKTNNNNIIALIHSQQQQIDDVNNNNKRKLLVGTSFPGKNCLMLRNLSRMPDRVIYSPKPLLNIIPILKSKLKK